MFIQGNLQAVFDALYAIGMIDPVIQMDWQELNQEMTNNPQLLNTAVSEINACRGDTQLIISKMNNLDQKALSFIAMEVAREMADYYDCKNVH